MAHFPSVHTILFFAALAFLMLSALLSEHNFQKKLKIIHRYNAETLYAFVNYRYNYVTISSENYDIPATFTDEWKDSKFWKATLFQFLSFSLSIATLVLSSVVGHGA